MYRTVDASFWADPDVRDLSVEERHLLLYLFTNPHTHVSGIYYLPAVMMAHETGLKEATIRKGIDTLSKGHLAFYDPKNEVVFVRSMFRYQAHGSKHNQAAANQLRSLRKSCMVNKFLSVYPEIEALVGEDFTYPIDRVSPVGPKDPEQDPEQDPDMELDMEQENPPTPLRGAQAIVDHWNAIRGDFPEVRMLTTERRRKINARVKGNGDLEHFKADLSQAVKNASDSEFARNGSWFGFDWLMKNDTNLAKMLEGQYQGGFKEWKP